MCKMVFIADSFWFNPKIRKGKGKGWKIKRLKVSNYKAGLPVKPEHVFRIVWRRPAAGRLYQRPSLQRTAFLVL